MSAAILPTPTPSAPDQPIRVLSVEDNEDDFELLRRQLSAFRYIAIDNVHDFNQSVSALEKASYDVVILDLGLPDSDGLQALERLRAVHPEIPVVVLTGDADHRTCVQAAKADAQAFLVKGEINGEGVLRSILQAVARNANHLEEVRSATALEVAAHRDALTGALNRRGLQKAMAGGLANRAYALLIDCDDFKAINSNFGHAGGDHILQVITRRLGNALRESDVLARVGGDEFLVLLGSVTREQAMDTADRLRAVIADRPVEYEKAHIHTTVSIGVAKVRTSEPDIEVLLRITRRALQDSKDQGKNRV
ncbi:MAG: diguanylate cyclase [Planctomycetota bacterium]